MAGQLSTMSKPPAGQNGSLTTQDLAAVERAIFVQLGL
jgi:hypothetical protein